ncbi:MAG: DNA gyrase subunit A, partial [Bacteroidales bacterium]|nr:DNA gyrase subunit A [Bacteroidales bacterium]
GIELGEENEAIGMICVNQTSEDVLPQILVVSENGYGKRSDITDYRITNRGGKGVKTLNITEKTGALIAIKDVTDDNDLMIINRSGITIRLAVSDLRIMGRATQGVKLINVRENDSIAAVCVVAKSEEKPAETADEPAESQSTESVQSE